MADAGAARHTGAGIARRQAFHERQRAEREELELQGGVQLPTETSAVASVRAVDMLDEVAEIGPNYFVLKRKESKKARRKRQQDEARERLAAAVIAGTDTTVDVEQVPEQQQVDGETLAVRVELPGSVRHSALSNALEDEEDEDEAMLPDAEPMLSAHGRGLSHGLRDVRRRLREFLAEQAAMEKSIPMEQSPNGLYPMMRWTIKFGKWLATTRNKKSRASAWHFVNILRVANLVSSYRQPLCRLRRSMMHMTKRLKPCTWGS